MYAEMELAANCLKMRAHFLWKRN